MLTPSIPLSSVSADQVRQELIDRLKLFFPDWTDQLESNNMMVLVELFSMLMEMDYAYLNRNAREAFLQFALDPSNIDAHARAMGYKPLFQQPAVVDEAVFTLSKPTTGITVIPIGTKVSTLLTGIVYETIAEITIPLGSSQVTGVLWQQESWTKAFQGTGEASQAILLDRLPTIPSSIKVVVNGTPWTEVDTFLESLATDKHYMVRVMNDGTAYVTCGDGISGSTFQLNASGSIKYKTGGGTAGTISSYMLGRVLSEVLDGGDNSPLSISVSNETAATPGVDRETPEQVRYHAINNLKKSRVLLTLEDIESEANGISGVAAAKAVNWTVTPALPHYELQVLITPDGLGIPSQSLLDRVAAALTVTKKLEMGTKLVVIGAKYRNLVFRVTLHVKAGYSFQTVAANMGNALAALFNPEVPNAWGFNPTFGMAIYTSLMVSILQQMDGVRNLVISLPGDTQLSYNEFPRLSNVNVFGDNGQTWNLN
jgi:hypothetical protein